MKSENRAKFLTAFLMGLMLSVVFNYSVLKGGQGWLKALLGDEKRQL